MPLLNITGSYPEGTGSVWDGTWTGGRGKSSPAAGNCPASPKTCRTLIIIIAAGQIRILTMLFKYFCQTPAKKKNNENNHILIFKNNGSTKSF